MLAAAVQLQGILLPDVAVHQGPHQAGAVEQQGVQRLQPCEGAASGLEKCMTGR